MEAVRRGTKKDDILELGGTKVEAERDCPSANLSSALAGVHARIPDELRDENSRITDVGFKL